MFLADSSIIRTGIIENDWSLLGEICVKYDSYGRDTNVDHLSRCTDQTALSDYLSDKYQVHLALIRFFEDLNVP